MRMIQDGGQNAVVTAATGGWGGSGTVTFMDVGDFVSLVWANVGSGAKWYPFEVQVTNGSAGLG